MSASANPARLVRERTPTILVVEEDVMVRLVIADYLRTCGFWVVEVSNTDEAVKALTTGLRVDVVLTPVYASGSMDGFGLAQWVRRKRPATRTVLSSGVRRTAELAGALCEKGPMLSKPYSVREVERRIRAILAH